MNYYNDNDPDVCATLRNMVKAGDIPPGDVDERSITEVTANDIEDYTQVHLFAGFAGWIGALDLADWPADRPVWSASCPCPPFSVAGKQQFCPECASKNLVWCPRRTGFAICADCRRAWFADARHLWPEVWRLASELRPAVLFGEQVESPTGVDWLSGVHGSLEIIGYVAGSSDLPAAGVGAPHKRARLFWVARRLDNAANGRTERPGPPVPRGDRSDHRILGTPGERDRGGELADADLDEPRDRGVQPGGRLLQPAEDPAALPVADTESVRGREHSQAIRGAPAERVRIQEGQDQGRPGIEAGRPIDSGAALPVAHAERPERRPVDRSCGDEGRDGLPRREEGAGRPGSDCEDGSVGIATGEGRETRVIDAPPERPRGATQPASDPWDECVFVRCRDGRLRRIPIPESGIQPLAHGLPAGMAGLDPGRRRLVSLAGLDGPALKRAKRYRMIALKGAGNMIVMQAAAVFVRAYMEAE